VSDGNQWQLIWAPVNGSPGSAIFLAELFSEEPAVLDALTSILSAKRFFAVAPSDTIESLLTESASAQEVVADQLGRQVRGAAEMLIASISRANLDRGGELLKGLEMSEIYSGAVTVLMRLVFLLFAEERGLLPLDDQMYASSYAVCTLREQLQSERDLFGDEPLERRSSAWFRLLALFRAVHGGITHESLRIPPYGGRLFDPDRFPFLEGRAIGEHWRVDAAVPIPVDDLTMLDVLTRLQVLNSTEGGIKEARQLSYRTLEVEQIGHVYEGLLDHSVRLVDDVVVGLVGKPGDEPEVTLIDVEIAAAGSRNDFVKWLVQMTGRTEKFLDKCLDTPPGENDRQLLAAVVDNDDALIARVLPFINLVTRDLRELPKVLLPGSFYSTQTSTRREGGVEYTTKDLAEEVARYALEPLVYSPGPQESPDETSWLLRPASEILALKVCDPAVGSGAILVAAGRYLADRLVEAWDTEGASEAIGSSEEVLIAARRAVADSCLYGVDRDPLATEMAKLSLWLTTMAKDRPFTFLDHAIRTGDSLLGITNLEQVRWMHLDPSEGQRIHRTLFDYRAQLEPLVEDAVERRRHLSKIRLISIRDAEDKARLMAEADTDLRSLSVIADLVVASTLSTASLKRTALDNRLLAVADLVASALSPALHPVQRDQLLAELGSTASGWLNEGKPENAPVRHCFHWPLQFPEVFVDRPEPGFDAIVGNPPFVGGTLISGSSGSDYRDFIVSAIANGQKGNADLVAFFFLRAATLARSFGFLATNTIAQGDTSEVGLQQLIDGGWTVWRAASSIPWPGRASLEIAKVWASSIEWLGKMELDGFQVHGIDEMLYPLSRSGWRKQKLAATRNKSFKGSFVFGLGFTMTPSEAEFLIAHDPSNREVLFPYIGGEDLNQSPTQVASRWVINFFDWDEERARSYPDCYSILEQKVKVDRRKNLEKGYDTAIRRGTFWWQYGSDSKTLYRTIEPLERVLAITLHSKSVLPIFVNAKQVFSHALAIFAYDDYFHFGVLTSSFHYRWAVRYASTLETRIRYTPSDCFETFPQPPETPVIAEAGRRLNEHRAQLMVDANEGLTTTYNRFHNEDDLSPGIVFLRELHRNLDLVVRDAYSWEDLDLGHGFHPVRGPGICYTLSPAAATEILSRLLELNRERYESEVVAGLHGGSKKTAKSKSNSAPVGTPTLFGVPTERETGTKS
jgi:hypothetical protein